MPEGLTQTKTPTSKDPAGFKSECRPVSFRNRGRLQIGTMAGFKSEYPAGINRNPHSFPRSSAIGLIMGDVVGACGAYQNPQVEVRFVSTALRMVEAGSGIALIDGFTAGFANREAVSIRKVATQRRVPLVLSRLRDRKPSIAADHFIKDHLLQARASTASPKRGLDQRTTERPTGKRRV